MHIFEVPDDDGKSDGESAVRAAQAREERRQKGAQRGPENTTLRHWNFPPVAVHDLKFGDRWRFDCRWCSSSVNGCILVVEALTDNT